MAISLTEKDYGGQLQATISCSGETDLSDIFQNTSLEEKGLLLPWIIVFPKASLLWITLATLLLYACSPLNITVMN